MLEQKIKKLIKWPIDQQQSAKMIAGVILLLASIACSDPESNLVVYGGGAVTSTSGALNCNSSVEYCTHRYETNASEKLTAVPQAGYVFGGWKKGNLGGIHQMDGTLSPTNSFSNLATICANSTTCTLSVGPDQTNSVSAFFLTSSVNGLKNTFGAPAADYQPQHLDNVPIWSTIEHRWFAAEVVVAAYVGASKVGSQVVATPYNPATASMSGFALFKNNWPLDSAAHDLTIYYCDPTQPDCVQGTATGTPTRHGIYLSSGLKVTRVWFHNTIDSSESTSFTQTMADNYVDFAGYNADDMLAGCADSNRWQMRYHTLDTVTVSNGKTRPYIDSAGMDYFVNLANARDANQDYLHVFLVNAISHPNGSAGGVARFGSNVIIMVDYADAYQILVHEFGHTRWLGHVDEDDADPLVKNHPEANNCNDPQAAKKNVMCSSNVDQQELLTAGQCTDMFTANSPIKDFN